MEPIDHTAIITGGTSDVGPESARLPATNQAKPSQ
jgi:hypothetical protein